MKPVARPVSAALFLLWLGVPARACITCDRKLRAAILDGDFYPNMALMFLPFAILTVLVVTLVFLSRRRFGMPHGEGANPLPLATAAVVLGMGAGGFADGILLHQILQWHGMLSARLPADTALAKSVNMFWDGVFHLFCLLMVLTGLLLLWQAGRRAGANQRGSLLWGGMLAGWGLFNLVEGVLNHQVLRLHNVRELADNIPAWNFGFLGFSVLLLGAGAWGLAQRQQWHR